MNNGKLARVILMGKKPGAATALRNLHARGIQIPFVVAKDDELYTDTLLKAANDLNIEVLTDPNEVYHRIETNHESVRDIDLVISYLYWGRVKQPLIELASRGCINFHPAPLPDYKSRAGYNTAILEGRTEFGVSVHFIDSEKFDAGPIIKVLRFSINPKTETVLNLEKESQVKMELLFDETMSLFQSEANIKTSENSGGLYLTAVELENLKKIDLDSEDVDSIDRKIRAFFFPPYAGAYIEVGGKKYTLVNESILKTIAEKLYK
jgi:methionyl-tRNA formyltransferase